MRRFLSVSIAFLAFFLITSAALAEDSSFNAGTIMVGAGYTSVNDSFGQYTTQNGANINWTYFLTENWAMALQAHFLSGSTLTGITDNFTPFEFQVEYHGNFLYSVGLYSGFGFGTVNGSRGGQTIKDNGFVYEVGLETKFGEKIVGNAGYKEIGVQGGKLSGFIAGLSYIF